MGNGKVANALSLVKSIRDGLALQNVEGESDTAERAFAFALRSEVTVKTGAKKVTDGTWPLVMAQFEDAGLHYGQNTLSKYWGDANFYADENGGPVAMIDDIRWAVYRLARQNSGADQAVAIGLVSAWHRGAVSKLGLGHTGRKNASPIDPTGIDQRDAFERYLTFLNTGNANTPTAAPDESEAGDGETGDDGEKDYVGVFVRSCDLIIAHLSEFSDHERNQIDMAVGLVIGAIAEEIAEEVETADQGR